MCEYFTSAFLFSAIAEIISKRKVEGKWKFYVHYVNCKLYGTKYCNVKVRQCHGFKAG